MGEFRLEGVPSNIADSSAWIGKTTAGEHLPLLDPGTGNILDPDTPHAIIQESHALMGGLKALAGPKMRQTLQVEIVHFDNDRRSLGPKFEEQLDGAHYLAVESPGWNDLASNAAFLSGARGEHPVDVYNRMYAAAGTQKKVPIIADWKREASNPSQAETALDALNNARYKAFESSGESYRTFQRLNVAYTGLREWVMLGRLGYGLTLREGANRALAGVGNKASDAPRNTEPVKVVLATDPMHVDLRRKLDILGVPNTTVDHTTGRDMDLMTAQLPEMLRNAKLIPERYVRDDNKRYRRYTHHYSPQKV